MLSGCGVQVLPEVWVLPPLCWTGVGVILLLSGQDVCRGQRLCPRYGSFTDAEWLLVCGVSALTSGSARGVGAIQCPVRNPVGKNV